MGKERGTGEKDWVNLRRKNIKQVKIVEKDKPKQKGKVINERGNGPNKWEEGKFSKSGLSEKKETKRGNRR